jgi:hypothetical protein
MIRVHVNWPNADDPIYLANPTEQNARKSFYGISGVPTIKFDGVITGTYNLEGSYTTRAAIPSHLDLLVCRNGSDMTGTISIRLIAEQDLAAEAALGFSAQSLRATCQEQGTGPARLSSRRSGTTFSAR